jgi:type I restriction enzyme R subunit
MSELNEDAIETNLIDLLKAQGYQYFHGSDLERECLDSVVLETQFKASLKKLNHDLPESARAETFQHVMHLGSNDIMTNNERFHQMLTDGVTVEYFKQGETIGLQVKLMDFDTPENNTFWVVNQFVIKELKFPRN